MLFRSIVFAIWIAIAALSICAQPREIRIYVTDTAGAAITNANVKIDPKNSAATVCSYRDDAYYCPVPDNGGFVLAAEARGFQPWRIEVPANSSLVSEHVAVLRVGSVAETVVTIGRTEGRISDSPESISVLPKQQIGATAGPTLDDALRQVPGFSIFRRSSSRNSNPTTQGVSLRGVGASGASRSVVMYDGIERFLEVDALGETVGTNQNVLAAVFDEFVNSLLTIGGREQARHRLNTNSR